MEARDKLAGNSLGKANDHWGRWSCRSHLALSRHTLAEALLCAGPGAMATKGVCEAGSQSSWSVGEAVRFW